MRFTHRASAALILFSLVSGLGFLAQPHPASPRKRRNMALGKSYTISPRPTYQYCTDAGDATQLTDGQKTTEYFWTQKGTVGWQHGAFVSIIVDLGKVEPISGAAFRAGAGTASVAWPAYIGVHVSDDGKTWFDAGDLLVMDLKEHGPLPEGYGIREFKTTGLGTHGRYVRFVVIPTGTYSFCDEVEVYRGGEELLKRKRSGKPVVDYKSLAKQFKMKSSILRRYGYDLKGISKMLESSGLPEGDVAPLMDGLTQAYEGAVG